MIENIYIYLDMKDDPNRIITYNNIMSSLIDETVSSSDDDLQLNMYLEHVDASILNKIHSKDHLKLYLNIPHTIPHENILILKKSYIFFIRNV